MINKACSKYRWNTDDTVLKNGGKRCHEYGCLYIEKDNIFNCMHAKVGTSSLIEEYTKFPHVRDANIVPLTLRHVRAYVENNYHVANTSKAYIKHIAENSLSFSFVRHPFERLVSCYRDKALHDTSVTGKFQRLATGDDGTVSFTNFARGVLEQHHNKCRYWWDCKLNPHYLPYSSRCDYCNIPYSIIGKMETWDDDIRHVMQQAGVNVKETGVNVKQLEDKKPLTDEQEKEHDEWNHNIATGSTREKTASYFNQLPSLVAEQLYNAYKMDFELFGYDPYVYMDKSRHTL